MATIQDIARLAGVSATTVSNVIHGNFKRVSPARVNEVRRIIRELNYVPNMSARSLKTNASHIIAAFNFIVPEESGGSFQDPFHSALLAGIEQELRHSDYFLMVRSISSAQELLSFLSTWSVDALILTGILSQDFYDELCTQPAPFLLVDSSVAGDRHLSMQLDDRRGGYLATRHLLDLGHRRILFCAPSPIGEGVIAQRLLGYRDALDEHGIAFNERMVRTCRMEISEGVALGRALADEGGFTAIFATADILAAGLMAGLQNAGLKVPDQVSVMGFDDLPVARLCVPQLTTVRQDVQARGRTAAQMLLKALKGECSEPLVFPVTLVQRGSTGKAPG